MARTFGRLMGFDSIFRFPEAGRVAFAMRTTLASLLFRIGWTSHTLELFFRIRHLVDANWQVAVAVIREVQLLLSIQ